MANSYLNVGTATAAGGTATLYTPGSGTALVGSLYVGNASGGTARTFSFSPDGTRYTHTDVTVPGNDTLQIDGVVLDGDNSKALTVIGEETDVEFVFMGVEIS